MKLAVLGSGGQLGRDLAQAAAAAAAGSFDIVSVDRARVDVTDAEALGRVLSDLEFDVLVNCTSYHRTDEVEGNASLAFAVNAHAVQRMARACAARRKRFVHVSTDYVFGGDFERDVPYREDDTPQPLNVYGASKAMGERLAVAECADTLVLRVASLFGVAGASGKGGNFVETMLRLAKSQPELRVVSDQTMSPTATADIAQWLLTLLAQRADAGTYHLVNSGQANWHAFATEIVRQAGLSTPVIAIPSAALNQPARRPGFSALANDKAAKVCGPMADWSDALNRYLRSKGHI